MTFQARYVFWKALGCGILEMVKELNTDRLSFKRSEDVCAYMYMHVCVDAVSHTKTDFQII